MDDEENMRIYWFSFERRLRKEDDREGLLVDYKEKSYGYDRVYEVGEKLWRERSSLRYLYEGDLSESKYCFYKGLGENERKRSVEISL